MLHLPKFLFVFSEKNVILVILRGPSDGGAAIGGYFVHGTGRDF